MTVFRRAVELPVSADQAWAWHAREGAFERLHPPLFGLSTPPDQGGLEDGAVRHLHVHLGPLRFRWRARHEDVQPGRRFVDVQETGLFRSWRHQHDFEPLSADRCRMVDRVDYELPLGALGRLFGGGEVRRRLERLFSHRHRRTVADLVRWGDGHRLRVAVSGSSGFVGSNLVPFLQAAGCEVFRLVRHEPRRDDELHWDVRKGPRPEDLSGLDAVIHLAGAGVADRRWTRRRKELLRDSRVPATRALCEAAARAESPPSRLIVASAIGWYDPHAGDRVQDESTSPVSNFLGDLCRDWEDACDPAREAGLSVANLRIGLVLGRGGGVLGKLLPAAQLGVAGPLGDGRQWASWIALDDVLGLVAWLLREGREVEGPVNAVAPTPLRLGEMVNELGDVLRRPTVLPVPAFALRLLVGRELADGLLLSGPRVVPSRALDAGFRFRTPDIAEALRTELSLGHRTDT